MVEQILTSLATYLAIEHALRLKHLRALGNLLNLWWSARILMVEQILASLSLCLAIEQALKL